jgi:DNA mismatch repair protein MutS
VLAEADVTTTVLFRSIPFDRPMEATEGTDPSMFADLNLDQVFAAVAAGRDECDLMPFFGVPLHDVEAVEYRHQILRDMEGEALSGALAEFANRMRDMRNQERMP